MQKKLIVIGGATASGKTGLAIRLALHYNTEIISADSRQCFKELTIGTAKPSEEELSAVKHHLINSHSIKERFNAGEFASVSKKILEELFNKNDVAIIAGGSGLYIKALLEGLDDLPSVSEEIRVLLKQRFKENGIQDLLDELKKSDPAYFEKVDKQNHQRVLRALEIIYSSGLPYSSFLKKKSTGNNFKTYCFCIDRPREELYEIINNRTDKMMDAGLLEETKSVFEYRFHPALQTVGYKELFDFLNDKVTLEQSIELIKQHTRNYAKRQLTWFRNQGEFNFLTSPAEEEIKKLIFLD